MPTGYYIRKPKPIQWRREGECFRCTSHACGSHGYVVRWWANKLHTIPRMILQRRLGQINSRILAIHSCDNRWCINPAHISAGTHSDNIKDAWNRTRKRWTPKRIRSRK